MRRSAGPPEPFERGSALGDAAGLDRRTGQVSTASLPGLEVRDFGVEDGGTFSEAKARIIAYWADECARDLDKLMTHFTHDAEVVTPDGAFRGHASVASLYKKSFDSFPGLRVEVKAGFAGRDAHCFEYSAVLCDTADDHWLIEGVNLMKLENGLISSLRSFEDAPRRLPRGGETKEWTARRTA